MSEVRQFSIDASEDALIELRQKLLFARWPDREPVSHGSQNGWSQGVPTQVLRPLAEYWREGYDWQRRVQHLNRFDQFIAPIPTGPLRQRIGEQDSPDSNANHPGETIDIHLIHQRSPHVDATPLLLTHGWPGSTVEFDQVIEPLTQPTRFGGTEADAFHVIAPSLPGFSFSGKPTTTGVGVEVIATMWAKLMATLGYDRYIAQGGDWGASITAHLAAQDPDHCLAAHMTLAMNARPTGEPVSAAERHATERMAYYARWDSGYSTQQRTRPQTVAYGLADSPIGQLAWIFEKFWAWTDHRDMPDEVLSIINRDQLLDNVMTYWVNNAAASSARLYWESFGRSSQPVVDVPVGFTVYPAEIVPPVRTWLDTAYPNIVYWNNQQRGGHFAAFEQPTAFVEDLRRFREKVLT